MNAPVTFTTAVCVGAVFACLLIAIMSLRRFGWLVGPSHRHSISRTFKLGLVVWLVAVGFSLRVDVRHAQALAKQSICKGHMKMWALSLHNYHEVHGHFPSSSVKVGGHPHSWRALVASYAVDPQFGDQYDFQSAWDSAENLALQDAVKRYFHCPDHALSDELTKTSYVAITGRRCVFRDDTYPPRRVEDLDPDAVLFVETKRTDIHWMAPDDLSYDKLVADRDYAESVLGGPHPNSGCYATVDGRIETIASIGIDELLRRCVVTDPPDDD